MPRSNARIVTGRRSLPIQSQSPPPARPQWDCKQYRIYGDSSVRAATLKFFGRTAAQVEEDIGVVGDHFGCNRSEAWKIALHLLARSVQAGGMEVRVPSTGDDEDPRCHPPHRKGCARRRVSQAAASRVGGVRRAKGRKQERRREL